MLQHIFFSQYPIQKYSLKKNNQQITTKKTTLMNHQHINMFNNKCWSLSIWTTLHLSDLE